MNSVHAHRALALVAAALAVAAALTQASSATPRFITAPELATRIIDRDPTLRVYDLRSRSEFDRFHVASAQHLTVSALREAALPAGATVVLYGNGEARAAQAWTIATDRGADAFVLRGGVQEWFVRIYEPRLAVDATPAERAQFEQASKFSRFFGGTTLTDIARSELLAAANIRRRGC